MIRFAISASLLAGCAQLIGVEDSHELRLDNLELSTGTLVPAFDPEVTSYAVTLPYVGPSLSLTASADSSLALTYDGASAKLDTPQSFDVPVGDMAIAVSVTSTSGVERTYTVAVHRKDLDLAFGSPKSVFGLMSMYAVQRADLNADGVDDLVSIGGDGTINTFVNDGTGVFTSSSASWVEGLSPREIAVADVSGDGIGDLLVTNGGLMVANGKGDGSFDTPADFGAFTATSAMAIGHVDADGYDDVIVGNGTGFVTPVFGRATGPVRGNDYQIDQIMMEPRIVRVAQIDGPKLVSLDSTEHVIVVTPVSDPTTRYPYQLDSNAYPSEMLVADFDSDGHDDIAFIDQVTGVVTVLTKFPNWTRTQVTVSGNPRALVIGDLDADGHPDLAMTSGNDLVVLRNDGTATFEQRRFSNMVDTPSALAIGDFNHDGRDDVIFTAGTSTLVMAFGVHRE
ncbi:MAG: FG-GAP-like repeat-containing protein [Kofleriaceae bacterium]